jgi:hypothetical protein
MIVSHHHRVLNLDADQQPAEIIDPFAEDGEKGRKEKNPAEEALKYIVYVIIPT